MKKLNPISLLGILAIFSLTLMSTACSSDDDDNSNGGEASSTELTLTNLVGTWQIIESTETEYSPDGTKEVVTGDETGNIGSRYVITSNGTVGNFSYREFDGDDEGWHEDGTFNFNITDGKVQVLNSDWVQTMSIVLGADKTMEIDYTWNGEEPGNHGTTHQKCKKIM